MGTIVSSSKSQTAFFFYGQWVCGHLFYRYDSSRAQTPQTIPGVDNLSPFPTSPRRTPVGAHRHLTESPLWFPFLEGPV